VRIPCITAFCLICWLEERLKISSLIGSVMVRIS
jgi:hypothetical protein